MIKRILIAITLLLLLVKPFIWAQSEDSSQRPNQVNYETAQTYEIGGIEVVGAVHTDAKGIVAISGLLVGEAIRIPSDQLSKAIRKIWKQGLFVDVGINIQKQVGDIVFLEIKVQEYPRFARHAYKGIPKGQHDDANAATRRYLHKGKAATPAMKKQAISALKELYVEKGFLEVSIEVEEEEDAIFKNAVRWIFNIKKGKRVRIEKINFHGLKKVKKGKLYRSMKETKRNNIWALLKPSKFIKEAYETDKQHLIAYYNEIGNRDAKIIKDSVYLVQKKNRKVLHIDLHIDEGNTYRFGDITFKGNTTYSDRILHNIMGIKKGDVYNSSLMNTRLEFDRNGRDIKTLYMDNGYLFFRADPIEKGVNGDSIDLEIRMVEGPIATIGKVTITGNSRTSEHVIRRELRTLPGNKFSRSDLIRSQRELIALNYFNPESLQINTPVNIEKGTVDIEYVVEEKVSDQIELSAGWGGSTVFGTVGLKLTNFSLRQFLKPETWSPLPAGDGQTLSFRIQTNGPAYQSYNFSFTEPWLGGKKPNSLTLSAYYSNFSNGYTPESSALERFQVAGVTLGWGTRLNFPDDFFVYQASVNYKKMDLLRWGDLNISSGTYHNLSFSQTLSRNSIDNPIFPTKGSNIALTLSLTLPYSLFSNQSTSDYTSMTEAQKYKMVEYHKWDFISEWYGQLAKNFVVKLGLKAGFLGYYNPNIGLTPFDRYELGGNGISNPQTIQGKDVISLRGYDVGHLAANANGAAIYNKFSVEFRYLISPNPSAMIWVLAFAEAGNVWSDFKNYNPFNLKRSAGLGIRVFLPAFGTLGFDYGLGFDKPGLDGVKDITKYGTFNIVLGVEPK
ncbi:outer membrane protein assembly factor BamA [Aureispira anguillae]|uniref:Outer membrane protein assembly factor BamA n=1 Tax=Aureispira anguillae TaxID=2864201 RepID=A0A915YFI4_9BACT|nr:outer membrane protein assembly factor BamA [Aureispira anguillae]BDS12173.1 outer membrane protein assembly factor BamA [Aureispira anguillae]